MFSKVLFSAFWITPEFQEHTNQLLITFILIDSLKTVLRWNYTIRPTDKRKKIHQNWKTAPQLSNKQKNVSKAALPAFVSVKGKVIENSHQAPIVFATVEFYQKGKLVSSTATDYQGKFSLPLATNERYEMVISFNGYKKVKYKNIYLNRPTVPEQVIRMRIKNKVSGLEILSYSLPVLDLLRYLVK